MSIDLNLNNKKLVLESIDHCKRVQPIMERLGIEPDGYWLPPLVTDTYNQPEWLLVGLTQYPFQEYRDAGGNVSKAVPTYRQDKLELALPEWVWVDLQARINRERDYIDQFLPDCWLEETDKAFRSWLKIVRTEQPGEPKRCATVDLICLLDGEELL